jgi:hypothetical protein
MNALTSDGVDRARRRKHAGGLQDLVRTAQLGDLTTQRFDLLALLVAQHVLAPALIGFDLAHLFAQRLGRDAHITPNVRNRAARLEHQPRRTLQQLRQVRLSPLQLDSQLSGRYAR